MKIAFILLWSFLVFVPTYAQASGRVLDIHEVVSAKGIKAWLVEDHSLPIITMHFAFAGAGAALDPPDKQGLSLMASNTFDEGAGSYDSQSFQKALIDNNISLSFASNRDCFSGALKMLTKHSALGFTLTRLALNEPRLDEEPVNRMRDTNLMRVRSSLSDPEWKAARLLNDIAFAGHPYAFNIGGTLTTLQNITPDDLKNFAKTRLGREQLRIVVVGDITAAYLEKVLDEIFGDLPESASLPKIADLSVQNGGQIVLYEHDIPQTIIEIMQPGIGRKDPDYYTGMVMNFILGGAGFGSRLTEEIREKRGLTYGIHTSFYDLNHLKAFSISTSTKNESVAEMLDLIIKELERIRNEPVSDDELSGTKSYLIGSFPLSLASTDSIAPILLGLMLDDLPVDYLDRRAERINAVTREDIQKLAKKILTPKQLTTVLVGKPQGVTPTKKTETLPNVE